MPTVLPFHRAVVDDPAFAGDSFGVHTRWIETEFSAVLEPQASAATEPEAARERLTVEVGGKRLEVVLPAMLAVPAAAARPGRGRTVQGPRAAAVALAGPPVARAATPWSRPCRARS